MGPSASRSGSACFFVSDLHGHLDRYDKLFASITAERPAAVFLGGDLLPSELSRLRGGDPTYQDFVQDVLVRGFETLRVALGEAYPRVFLLLGNDDPRVEEAALLSAAARGLFDYVHDRRVAWEANTVYGYSMVPPTPFRLKDWERYDVSRYVDPGSYAPAEGRHTVPVSEHELEYDTIREGLERLAGEDDLSRAILLFHGPPYQTLLDRAALDGKKVDHVPLDVHIGSIAVRRFIEARQPLLGLHGHVHEAPRLTGSWRDRLGRTELFSAAHDGPELALVRFDPEHLEQATRELV